MNNPDQDEQLPAQVSRVLAADTEVPSVETDQRILQFAAQQAPISQSISWKTWMPATAACCLVGVLTLSLLPEQKTEPVQSMEMDTQLVKSREAIQEATVQSDEALAGVALADEMLLEESEIALSAPAADFATTTAAEISTAQAKTDKTMQLSSKYFERLVALSEQENSVRNFSGSLAQAKPESIALQTAKKQAQRSADAESSALIRAKVSPNNNRYIAYETLRRECNCGLPNTLQQALGMLADQRIQLDDSEPQAMVDKQ